MNRHDVRRSRVDPDPGQDWDEHLPVFLEGLLGLPHLVDHEVTVLAARPVAVGCDG